MSLMNRIVPVTVVCVAAVAGLAACSTDEVQTVTTSGPTVTITSSREATTVERSANDALGELDAWNACSSAAQAGYVLQNPGSAVVPYDTSRAPQKNADGSYAVNVGITPPKSAGVNGGIVAICTVKGTLGAPEIVKLSYKDI